MAGPLEPTKHRIAFLCALPYENNFASFDQNQCESRPGHGFNRILIWTVQIQLLFSLLLAPGLVL
jgi:hypothetical protein